MISSVGVVTGDWSFRNLDLWRFVRLILPFFRWTTDKTKRTEIERVICLRAKASRRKNFEVLVMRPPISRYHMAIIHWSFTSANKSIVFYLNSEHKMNDNWLLKSQWLFFWLFNDVAQRQQGWKQLFQGSFAWKEWNLLECNFDWLTYEDKYIDRAQKWIWELVDRDFASLKSYFVFYATMI